MGTQWPTNGTWLDQIAKDCKQDKKCWPRVEMIIGVRSIILHLISIWLINC